MNLIFSNRFSNELDNIINFIKKDNAYNALKFYDNLIECIKLIPTMPFSYRKSEKYDNTNIREMIFKKYTIIFQIDKDNIIILGIFNQNLWTK